jgi:hypothetical protein
MINEKQSVYEVELEFDLKKFNTTFPLFRDFPYLHLSGSDVMLTHPLSFFEGREQISYVLEMYGEFIQSIIRSLQSKELSRYQLKELIVGILPTGPIESLNLITRTFNCLKRRNINSISDVMSKTFQELTDIPNFGRSSADDLLYSILLLTILDSEFKAGRKYVETPHTSYPDFQNLESMRPDGLDQSGTNDWIANNREIYESVLNQQSGSGKFPNFTSEQDTLFCRVANVIQFINPDFTFGDLLEVMPIFQLKPLSEVSKWELIAKNSIVNSNDDFHFRNWGNFFHDWNSKNIMVLTSRVTSPNPDTLQDIANHLGLTRERIRQIENNVRDSIFAELSNKDSILPILSSYFQKIVGNVARRSILMKNNQWLQSHPIPTFYLNDNNEGDIKSFTDIELIDVLIFASPNIKTYGDLIIGGDLFKVDLELENINEVLDTDIGAVTKSFSVENLRSLFVGIYSDDQSFDDYCKSLNLDVLWKSLVPGNTPLSKRIFIILNDAKIPLDISSINAALNSGYAKKSVSNELSSNPLFAQTFDGLWQINTNFNKIEKKDHPEVPVEKVSPHDVNNKLILDTVELDSSEVVKLKRDIK